MEEARFQALGGVLSFLALERSQNIVKSTRLFEMTVDKRGWL